MRDEADIGLVDAHAEGDGGHQHQPLGGAGTHPGCAARVSAGSPA